MISATMIEMMFDATTITAEITVITADRRVIVAAFTVLRFDLTPFAPDLRKRTDDFRTTRADAPRRASSPVVPRDDVPEIVAYFARAKHSVTFAKCACFVQSRYACFAAPPLPDAW